MRYLELRRHSTRIPDTEHLSPAGIALARRMGRGMGAFALVVCSPSTWTRATAEAMGYVVDEVYLPVPFSEDEWKVIGRLLPPGTPFTRRAEVLTGHAVGRRFAARLRAQWEGMADRLPDEGTALVVTHGGYIDNSAVACLPDAEHQSWGPNFGHCEGVGLAWDGRRFVKGVVLRAAH